MSLDIADTFKIVATFAGAGWALFLFSRAIKEKAHETRIRQAAASEAQLSALWASEKSRGAMRMLDWQGRSYTYEGKVHNVDHDDVKRALRVDDLDFDDKETMIRDYFEDFLDRIELMHHYCQTRYLHEDDLMVPLGYYGQIIVSDESTFRDFIENYGYQRARTFLTRAARKRSADAEARSLRKNEHWSLSR